MNFLGLSAEEVSIYKLLRNFARDMRPPKLIPLRRSLFILTFLCLAAAVNGQESTSGTALQRYLQQELGAPLTRCNDIDLLLSGHDKFIDLFDAIRQAQHHIHLEYFNFRNDSIANTLFDLLAEKVEQGVEVRAMFDAFGNSSNNQPLEKEHIAAIRERGIELVKFDPMNFPWLNHVMHRDHRKIVVIDGRIGYTGGMNIADYYINGTPELGAWRDIHMHIEGDAVRYLQGIFLTMWNRETGQHIGGSAYFPEEGEGGANQSEDCSVGIAIVDRVPRETASDIRRAYATAIEGAEHSIRIINPYFAPTHKVRRAIKRALKKGTEVEIMIPAVSDIPFTPEASFYIVHKLMKRGAKIYLYNGGFHHSKIMMVDSIYCTVGTANLNSRSLRYDYETNAFIFDPTTTAKLNAMYDRDILDSTEMTPEYWRKRSRWKKFVGWFGNLLTPFI